jgi:hypothetical protein
VSCLGSGNNAVLVNSCQNLQNLQVTLAVSEDLVTLGNTGFSLQLNCYPQIGSKSPNATPQTGDSSLTWFQYVLFVTNNQVTWEIQYWANNAHSYQEGPPKIVWPQGYTPNPPDTSPWLPVFPNTAISGTLPTSAPLNQVPAGSVIKIQLATDTNGNVTGATFSIADPSGVVHPDSTKPWQQYAGVPEPQQFALYPIYGFQVNLVGPGNFSSCTFSSGAGAFTYSVSPGSLAVQDANTACGGLQPGTGESSNIVYGDLIPASGPAVKQIFQKQKALEMSESVVVVRDDGTEDRFDVMPDGTGRHVATSSPPGGAPQSDDVLPGSWSKFYTAWWAADGTLHVRGYGWQANQGGQVFELVWSNGNWGTPFQPNNI